MKLFFTLLILNIVSPILGFAQDDIRDQPDSIYKANNVKSKIEQTNGSYIGKIITNYNRHGKATEVLELDTSNRIYTRTIFEYDENLKCEQTTSYSYNYEDPITNKKLKTPYIDSNFIFITKFEYDKNNMLKSETRRNFNGKLYSIKLYSYNPKTEINQYYQFDKVEAENKTFFSENGLRTKELRTNTTERWDFTYSYKYNSIGQIIETTFDIKYSTTSKTTPHKINYPIKETYEYFQNGLLEKYTYLYETNTSWIHNLTYEYW